MRLVFALVGYFSLDIMVEVSGGKLLSQKSKVPVPLSSFIPGRSSHTLIRVSKKGVLVPDLTDFSRQTMVEGDKDKTLVFLVSASPNAEADT